MPSRVLVVPDKFKGTLTALQAAEAIAAGWRAGRAQDQVELLPMSDGGDGFGEILGRLLEATPRMCRTLDAAHQPCEALWWWDARTATAVIESARAIGLAQLPKGKFHPFELDTDGLGLLLKSAAEQGARRCLVGIGGSATNDAGFGMAKALGWQFFNAHDEKIDRWTELHRLATIRPPDRRCWFEELVVAVDVQNPLLGPRGCTRVYGPQKGLRPEDFDFADRCLGQLSRMLTRVLHLDHAAEPGAGAAGGLGYGLRCFLGATLQPGFELFAQLAHLEERLARVDLVLTGEGAIDASTLMGKGVGELAALCRARRLPCVAFGGIVQDPPAAASLFHAAHALAPSFVSVEEALAQPASCLERLAAKVAAEWRPADA